MDDLALRLAALDPEAGAALRAIGHFDALLAARAGLQEIVRGVAELAGCPARFVDPDRGLVVRARADGALEPSPAEPSPAEPDPAWPGWRWRARGPGSCSSGPGSPGPGTPWCSNGRRPRSAPCSTGPAVLDRTRRARPGADRASLEVVLDAGADPADRVRAARRVGLVGPARAVATADGGSGVLGAIDELPAGARCGVGPAVAVPDLPASAEAARLALRLTAEGTEDDPGPRVVHAEEVAAVLLLVRAADAVPPLPDVRALDAAAAAGPWVLSTLDAVVTATSQRDAARALHLHHSSLQDRLLHAEHLLGWDVRGPAGRLRLQLALHLRRAARSR